MADFDLTQTDAQVQSILNDGQNMQGAGAQTTLTTESVLLKDVNGNYHKILKSSFTEAIRDTLAGLLVNNDKGTTINQIAAIANSDFGSITPANLASVLGVTFKDRGQAPSDADNATESGFYWNTGQMHFVTEETNWYGILCVLKTYAYTIQIHFSTATNIMYFRNKETGSSNWSSWKKVAFSQ